MAIPHHPERPDRPDHKACALPLPLPSTRREQALLLMFRRMAIHGLHDAHASMVALNQFGGGFLRALHLMRAFLHGLPRHASGRIQVAPDGYADLLTLAQALQGEVAA